MATAAQIQAKIDSLKAAMDAGVLIVQHGQDRVQYQTYSDMSKALARLKAELATVNGEMPRSKVNYIEQHSKGYGGHGFGSFIGKDFE